MRTTRVTPEKRAFCKLYAPPLYSKVTPSKTQPSQSNPSNSCLTPLIEPVQYRGPSATEALGSAPNILFPLTSGGPSRWKFVNWQGRCAGKDCAGGDVTCAIIDVWLPKSDMLQAPTMNDSNATVTLDITPPVSGNPGKCAIWKYHYGEAPPKTGGTIRQKNRSRKKTL
jgi:hypothetical protein